MLVYDPAKDGVDAGVLCGEEPVGVAATDDRAAIRALGADCVLYMPRVFDLDDVVALLEAGTNVVTTRGELFGGGRRLGDEDAGARRSTRARAAASSIYATGSSPGSSPTRFRSRCCRCSATSTSIEIDEFANLSRRDSPHMLFEQMGFGAAARRRSTRAAPRTSLGEFRPSLDAARRGRGPAGRRVDEHAARSRPRGTTTTLVAGELAAGTVAAQRTTIVGTQRRRRRRAVHGQLVLHDRRRAGVGPPADGLAGAGARRRAARRRPHVSGAARGARFVHARVHREPAGERDPVRVRGAAGHPLDHRSAADHPAGPRSATSAGRSAGTP